MTDGKLEVVLTKDELVQAIQGSKRAVIERGHSVFEPRKEIVLKTEDDKSSAKTLIKSVTMKAYGDLEWTDAMDCGFGNVETFRANLESRYEQLGDEQLMTIVRF